MKINDELLSGFLDAELPEAQMEEIRDLLAEDEQLAERLAELAQVDFWVAKHAAQIDQKPLPDGITQLLTTGAKVEKDNVVEMSLWRKINVAATPHTALAAGVAIVFGIGMSSLMQDELFNGNNAVPTQVANILDTHTSGQSIATDDGTEVKPHFSFENKNGQYCRHYQLSQADNTSANVACRDDNDWLVVASVKTESINIQGQYQAASGAGQLEEQIDKLSMGPVFDLAQEKAAIAKAWQSSNK